MSFPFRLDFCPDLFSHLVKHLRSVVAGFPDERTGDTTYSMADAALGAFAVFFTQSPSWLDFQRTLQVAKGCNNALSLFGITQIPTANQTRNLLDPVPPRALLPVFATVVEALRGGGQLEAYRSINGDLLVAMDGTQYHFSAKVHCPQCRVTEHRNGTTTYSHQVVTPVIVAPGNPRVLPLEPEFIVPQDGHDKQDCENAAAKRWLDQFAARRRKQQQFGQPAFRLPGLDQLAQAFAQLRATRFAETLDVKFQLAEIIHQPRCVGAFAHAVNALECD